MTNRQAAALETRRRLISTAKHMICEKGLAGTSVEEITQACGVSKGTFYTYFKRKEDVVQELSRDMFGEILAEAQGLIKHMGFSFHSTPGELDAILTAHPEMEFVQLQINYADWDYPAVQSRRCYEVARAHGKPVIIMEPVKGGMLANPPESVQKILRDAEPDMSIPSWAIRFAANLEGIITVLSGMSSVEQMEDNLSYMKSFKGLTEAEQATLHAAQQEFSSIPMIPCTTCNYCAKVCPMHIGISGTFTGMNYLTLYKDLAAAKHQEEWLVGGHGLKPAAECIKCGKCEQACPQHIAIREELVRSSKALNPES